MMKQTGFGLRTGCSLTADVCSFMARLLPLDAHSAHAPTKRANFGPRYADFGARQQYSDWKFVFVPEQAASVTAAEARKD